MEDALIRLIKQSADTNDTRSLKEFICSHSKVSLIIDDATLHCLKSIIHDGTNKLNGVNCVLSFITYFYEQNHDKNIWDKLAKTFSELCIMCLKECTLNKKYDEVETVLVYLSKIVLELIKQSPLIVKSIHYLMVPPLIKTITEEDFSFKVKFSLVNTLSSILKCSTKDNHSEININFQKDMANFANWILMCGDFETQTIILETLLYFLTGIDNQNVFCAKWFYLYPQIKADFFKRDFSDFEPESRLFLNLVNKLNKKPLVYSLGCICAFTDEIKFQKPNDSKYLIFWVDFNTYSESVDIYFEGNNKMWEIFQLCTKNILKVCSNSGKYNLNNQMTPIVKLCFTLSYDSTDFATNYVEIWFEICEEFRNLEINFLIPIYGFKYDCNWKANMSNTILSNEVLSSEMSCSVAQCVDQVCSQEYTPLPVVETLRKSSLGNESIPKSGQNLESIVKQSQNRKKLESIHNIMETDVNFDEGSNGEIISSPDLAPVKNSKKILRHVQEKELNVSYSRKNQSYVVVKNKQNVQKISNDRTEKKVDQDIHDKEIQIYKKCHTQVGNVVPKVIDSAYKQTKSTSHDVFNLEHEIEYTSAKQEHKFTIRKTSPKIIDNRKFFKGDQSVATTLTPTRIPQDFIGKTKSVYSDFSSSSEKLKSVKKTYLKQKNLKKNNRKRKISLHVLSDSDSDYVPEKFNSRTAFIANKNYPIRSYVSNLEKKPDPLRFKNKDNESNTDHLDISGLPVMLATKQKEIGKTIFKVFDNAKENIIENLYVQHEEIPINDFNHSIEQTNLLTMQNKDSSKKLKLNLAKENTLKSKQLKNFQLPLKNDKQNDCNEQNVDFSSDHEVQDMEMSIVSNVAISINGTNFDLKCSSPKQSCQSINRKKSLPLKEHHLPKFGTLILKNLSKNIDESKTTMKTEREDLHVHFISEMEAHKKNIASISVNLVKCKKALDKTNNKIEKTIQSFAKNILENECKQSALIAKHVKDFESGIEEFARMYTENMKQ